MPLPLQRLVRRARAAQLLPSAGAALGVVALFALAAWWAQASGPWIQGALQGHTPLGMALFWLSSVTAVLLPMVTNLPLVPLATVAWGPWWTASLLLAGWTVGAALSFTVGRRAGSWLMRRMPSVQRHADIDRLIHPRHRMLSLVLLRMTFPVDVLSYALGLFSRHTTAAQNALATLIGAAPFSLVFAWVPALPPGTQAWTIAASVLVFVVYVAWILRQPTAGGPAPPGAGAG